MENALPAMSSEEVLAIAIVALFLMAFLPASTNSYGTTNDSQPSWLETTDQIRQRYNAERDNEYQIKRSQGLYSERSTVRISPAIGSCYCRATMHTAIRRQSTNSVPLSIMKTQRLRG